MKKIAVLLLSALLASPLSAATVGSTGTPGPASVPAAGEPAKKLDLNLATVAELVAVPGIGPRTAQSIVDLRTKKGSFASLEELLEVRGIKTRKLDSLSTYLTVLPVKSASQAPVGVSPK